MTESEIAKIIRSWCYAFIQYKEGKTAHTDDIERIEVGGVEYAARDIAEAQRGKCR